jgi:hypothetical protein
MSVKIRTTTSTDSVQEKGYSITPVIPFFTDWNGGEAVADKPEEATTGPSTDRATMEMGNETLIGTSDIKETPPSQSYIFKGKNLYERFRSHNRDTWYWHREDSTISSDVIGDYKKHLIFAFADEVKLNSYQKQRAFSRFLELDLRRGTGRTERNAFIICSLIANGDAEQHGNDKLYHPQRAAKNNNDQFERLEKSLISRFPKVTKSSLTKVYNKHKQGSVPTRQPSKWEAKVKRESNIPYSPSAVSDHYEQSK